MVACFPECGRIAKETARLRKEIAGGSGYDGGLGSDLTEGGEAWLKRRV